MSANENEKITQAEIYNIQSDKCDASTLGNVYNKLISQGPDAYGSGKISDFMKLSNILIKKYVGWNDYIHSNNIMQLYKVVSEEAKKPSWFIRYEIMIYGRRTPLYFIDKPFALFDRMNTVFSREDEKQTTRLTGAVVDLCNYYSENFLSKNTLKEEKDLAISHINDNFAKGYSEVDKSLFTEEVKKAITDIIDYAKNPKKYIKPGLSIDEYNSWLDVDEDEDLTPLSEISQSSETASYKKEEESTIERVQGVEPVSEAENELKYLKGKTIKILGAIKNSIVEKINYWAGKYKFEADITDYDKITNLDFRNFQYSNKYAAIIAGPMPHSVKGMNGYSSGLEMLRSEPGYPPVFDCTVNTANGLLKVTAKSVWKALGDINYRLMSRD